MSKTQVRKKGFSFLSFFLGFLFAIIVLVGAVAGVVIYALSTDLDTLLSTVGVDNSKDEEGNNKIVNTDPENGGVTSVLELLSAVAAFATDYESKTISDVENLLPVASGLVDSVYDMVNQYVSVDKEDIKAVKFSEFGEYLTDVVYDIQPASFFDPSGNVLIEALLLGVNADYVEVSGVNYPVWYDDNGVYFYDAGEGNYFVVENGENAYTATTTAYTYDEATAHCTGNFYYANADETGERITVSPITIGSFINGGDFLEPLNKIEITEFIGGEEGGVVDKILGGVSVGDLIGGEFNFDDKINDLKISDFVEVDDNKILTAIGDCTLSTIPERMETIKIKEILDVDGNSILESIAECTLSQVPDAINDLTIGELVDTKDSKILQAIADCTLSTIPQRMETLTIGQIIDIPADNNLLNALSGCTLSTVASTIDTLTLGEIMTIPADNKLLNALSKCTLSTVGDEIDTLTLGEIITIPADSKILNALSGYTVNNLSEGIEGLKLYQVIDIDTGNKLLDALKNETINNLGNAVNGLRINDLYAERDESNNLTGIWKQLLCTRNADGSYTENPYTLNQFGELVNNITENMKTATLYELDDAGILTFEDKDTLNKQIGGKPLGEYTITAALEVLTAIL